jgi:hypothetical protein
MTLEQFITSLRINCLIFIVYLIFNFKEHGIETLFLFYLAVYNNTYIHTKLPKYACFLFLVSSNSFIFKIKRKS